MRPPSAARDDGTKAKAPTVATAEARGGGPRRERRSIRARAADSPAAAGRAVGVARCACGGSLLDRLDAMIVVTGVGMDSISLGLGWGVYVGVSVKSEVQRDTYVLEADHTGYRARTSHPTIPVPTNALDVATQVSIDRSSSGATCVPTRPSGCLHSGAIAERPTSTTM